ncbi:MAG TPA: Wzz/FepE/Etk N-terminal domain-containing protein [Verrucomicrobiae bacterium]|nr:Wzz/FepE/Etk N-terminal domain-containing protein [Verrucomicrobiae bacterium]
MSDKNQDAPSAAISPGDIYFVLFRRKWLICFFALGGILGAALLLFVIKPPQYQSEAMLSILYVVEGKSLTTPGDDQNTISLNSRSDSIINTELAILHGLDLANQVVQAITPQRILAGLGGGSDTNRAAYIVSRGLTAEQIPDSSVIRITFQNPDPKLVQPVLSAVIDAYLEQHVQMHQGISASDSFLTNETVRLRAELAQTDDALRKLIRTAGIISVDDAQKTYADQISKIRQNLSDAKAELSEHQAILDELTKSSEISPEPANTNSAVAVDAAQVNKYRDICTHLAFLKAKEEDYLTQQGFTTENVWVREVHAQIVQTEASKKNLETQFPQLTTLNVPLIVPQSGGQPVTVATDLKNESGQVAGLKAKIKELNSELNRVWTDATNFQNVQTAIVELEQKKQVEENNLKYFTSSLEKARMDDVFGVDKAANISVFQKPSPPSKGWSKAFKKKVAMVAAGGIFGGLALAFLLELVLDGSVKRPTDVKNKLRLPLFITIPDMHRNGRTSSKLTDKPQLLLTPPDNQASVNAGKKSGPENGSLVPWSRQNPMYHFYEGLRDRLIVNFEARNLKHNPKLVAVTSCNKGAGVSSTAAGLAATLSETGVGNVLLVDMNVEGGSAHQFQKGKLACGVDDVLEAEKRQNALVQDNLYVAAEPLEESDKLPRVLPKRLTGLIPRLKASDYDYIIFDMPPVNQTSPTARMAGLMDQVLLVIESEKTGKETVKQVISLLNESNAKVSTVLNKVRTYVPAALHRDFLD